VIFWEWMMRNKYDMRKKAQEWRIYAEKNHQSHARSDSGNCHDAVSEPGSRVKIKQDGSVFVCRADSPSEGGRGGTRQNGHLPNRP